MAARSQSNGVREPGVKVTKRPKKDRTTKKDQDIPIVVRKNMTVNEIISSYPQATEILAQYGLHCFGCSASDIESLEEGCKGHGFDEQDIDNLVDDINEMIALTPPRPQTLTITGSAARGIEDIAKKENKKGHGLAVIADEHGGFFLEFRKEPERGDKVFSPEEGPTIEIYASILTLQRIGGATIDFREGRFKLDVDLPDACGCSDDSCGCK